MWVALTNISYLSLMIAAFQQTQSCFKTERLLKLFLRQADSKGVDLKCNFQPKLSVP